MATATKRKARKAADAAPQPTVPVQFIDYNGQPAVKMFFSESEAHEWKCDHVCGCCTGEITSHFHQCLFGRERWCSSCQKQMKPGPYVKFFAEDKGNDPARKTCNKQDSAALADQAVLAALGQLPTELREVLAEPASLTPRQRKSGHWTPERQTVPCVALRVMRAVDDVYGINDSQCGLEFVFPADDRLADRLAMFSKSLRIEDGKRVMAALGR